MLLISMSEAVDISSISGYRERDTAAMVGIIEVPYALETNGAAGRIRRGFTSLGNMRALGIG